MTSAPAPTARGARRWRRAVACAAVVALSWLAAACGNSSESSVDPGSPIVATQRALVDTSRPTPANGSYPGAPDRTLATRLWYRETPPPPNPACGNDGACGLIVVAHGYGGSTARLDRFARALAELGWIVAAPTFPLTNQSAPGGLDIFDFVNQPADLSFVITSLLDASKNSSDELNGRIDARFIGLVGHSLGGATVVAATRVQGLIDSRVSAVVGFAPAVVVIPAILHVQPAADGPPLLLIQGTIDQAISYDSSQQFYDTLAPVKAFLGVTGADHVTTIEYDAAATQVYPGTFIPETADATLAFFAAMKAGKTEPLVRDLNEIAARGNVAEIDLGGR